LFRGMRFISKEIVPFIRKKCEVLTCYFVMEVILRILFLLY
jgi:hypothetical protein